MNRHRPYPLFAGALFLTMLVSTFSEFVIGVLAPILVDELGIGEAVIGAIAASMYLSAAAFARYWGRLLDVVSGRTVLVVLYGASIGSLTLIATGTTLAWLIVAGLLSGVALSVNNPVTSRFIVDRLPHGQRGFTLGVKQVGVKFGQMVAGASIPWLSSSIGWRPALLLFAVAALALLPVALAILPEVPGAATPASSVASARGQVAWLRRYAVMMAVGQSGTTTYLALYAVQALELSFTRAGLAVSAFGLSAAVARLAWVTVAERFAHPSSPLVLISGAGACSLMLLVLVPTLGPAALWAGAALAGASVGSWNVVVQLAVLAEVESDRTGSATGAVQSAFMFGMAMGAPVFGGIVQLTGSFTAAWGVGVGLALGALGTAARRRALIGVQRSMSGRPGPTGLAS
jgi:predicted MFS family arabinose efflux permease